jgi:fructose-1,6-bisphosphatase/inositol monophosphatase family enzyme
MAPFSKSLVTAEFGNERTSSNLDPKLRMIDRFIKAPSRGMRSIGSAALNMCLVAQGILDVYFEFGIHSWDIAAGWIILSEAGGLSVNFFKENDQSELPRNESFDLCARNILCVRPGESIEAMEALIHVSRKFLEKVPGYDRD